MPRRRQTSRREGPIERPYRRRARRHRVLIYCGGARTEPDYFDGLRLSDLLGHVRLEVRQKGVSPSALVRDAAEFVRDFPDQHDEVWCVVDVDEFADIPEATRIAERAGVRLAVSQPCFELWLLLHHTDRRAPAPNCREVVARLRRHLPRYDKVVTFGDFKAGVATAIERAKALEDPERGTPDLYTGVWRLVEGLINAKEAS